MPRSYLKRWSDCEKRIFDYRVLVQHESVKKWRQIHINEIGFLKDLYTTVVEGEENDAFENWLEHDIETPCSPIIDKAISDQRLSSDEWEKLVEYVVVQQLRTPKGFLESSKLWNEENFKATFENIVSKIGIDLIRSNEEGDVITLGKDDPVAPMPFKAKYWQEGDQYVLDYSLCVGRRFWQSFVRDFVKNWVPKLQKQRWTIFKAPQSTKWITSDNPVVRVGYWNPKKYQLESPYGITGTDIFLPLDPMNLLFVEIDRPRRPRGTVVSDFQAHELNRLIAKNAYRHVFSSEVVPYIERVKPRHVSREEYEREEKQWKELHQKQSEMEDDY